jgi:toxin secretion/phage lysis holin
MDKLSELLNNIQFKSSIWVLAIPIILMGVDILTGLTNAWIRKEVDSSKLRKGLGKKLGEIASLFIGEIFIMGLNISVLLVDAISIYLIVMELISICENLEQLGVPIPKFIRQALAVTQQDIADAEYEPKKEETDDKEE